jgi:hypothetical protein
MTPNGGDREPRAREFLAWVRRNSSKAIRFKLAVPILVVLKHYAISVNFAAPSALGHIRSFTILVRLRAIEAQVVDFLIPLEPLTPLDIG